LSLVVAFKDPDGTACHSLLTHKQLYLLGVRAKVTRWKVKPRPSHTTSSPTAGPDDKSVAEPMYPGTPEDDAMDEEPYSPTPTPVTHKHRLPSTPTKPTTSKSPKKKL